MTASLHVYHKIEVDKHNATRMGRASAHKFGPDVLHGGGFYVTDDKTGVRSIAEKAAA